MVIQAKEFLSLLTVILPIAGENINYNVLT